jgi:hypothetical protein
MFREIIPTSTTGRAGGLHPESGARLPAFIAPRVDPAAALRQLRVALVGVGSVGRAVALGLARLNVARLSIVDPARYKPESLLTQPIGPEDVLQKKASNTARACKRISPPTRVFSHDGTAQSLPVVSLADADIVLLASDNLSAEIDVGQTCIHLQKPLVHVSVHGDTLVAQVRFFANAGGEGPCPACAYGAHEWRLLDEEAVFRCGGPDSRSPDSDIPRKVAPTMSVAFLCSLAADLTLVQVARHAIGLGAPVSDTLLEYCGYTHATTVSALRRNPDCPCDHSAWMEAAAPRPLDECTLGELALAADGARAPEDTEPAFGIDEFDYVETAACACGGSQPVGRFLRAGAPLGRCSACGERLSAHGFFSRHLAAASAIPSLLDRALVDVAPRPPRWVIVRRGDRTTLFRHDATSFRHDAPHAGRAPKKDA